MDTELGFDYLAGDTGDTLLEARTLPRPEILFRQSRMQRGATRHALSKLGTSPHEQSSDVLSFASRFRFPIFNFRFPSCRISNSRIGQK